MVCNYTICRVVVLGVVDANFKKNNPSMEDTASITKQVHHEERFNNSCSLCN